MSLYGNLRYAGQEFRREPRLTSLYSDFRTQRESNPDGYIANCAAWVKALVFLVEDFPDRFVLKCNYAFVGSLYSPDHGRPLALGAAVQHGVDTGELMPLKDFKSAQTSVLSKSRIPTAGQVISWGLSRIGLKGRNDDTHWVKGSELIVLPALKDASEHIMDKISKAHLSSTDLIFSFDTWSDFFKGVTIGRELYIPEEYQLLMTFMSRDQNLAAYDSSSGTVKFKSDSETAPSPITKEDIDIASLRSLINTIQRKTTELDKRIADLNQELRKAITSKNNSAAKNALRSKKLAEATLQSRTSSLHQLQDVYSKIEQAADQVEIVRVMEIAGKTLKVLNERTGGADKIQDIMDDLRDEISNTDEIGTVINEDAAATIDETEVDDELEILEQAERDKEAQAEEKARQLKLEEEAEETRKMLAALESPTKAAFREDAMPLGKHEESVPQSQTSRGSQEDAQAVS